MKCCKIIPICLVLVLLYIPISGQTFDLSYEEMGLSRQSKEIDNSHLTIMGFTIGQCTQVDIQAKMGEAKIFTHKEGSDYLCYSSKLDKTILIFGFADDYLSDFMMLSDEAEFKDRDQCTETCLISNELHTESGIKLGMTRRQLKKLLGKPAKESKTKLVYRNHWKMKWTDSEIDRIARLSSPKGADAIRKNPYWDVVVFIDADFYRSKLIAIKLAKTETR